MAAGQANLLLSDLSPSVRRVSVLARVARAWEFHKDNELMHLDFVFVDEKGTKMYGEIHAAHAELFKEKLTEGNLCLIKDFFVNSSKNMYKAVEGSFMIKLTPWSKVEVQHDIPAGYPRYAYSLTDFTLLPTMIGRTDMFVDVIGILSGISDLQKVRLPGRAQESEKRNLQITDIDGNIMDVALWGSHATSFQADDLYNLGQKEPIIVLFVGTLIKSYLGTPTISCSDAAKVYTNPAIPEKVEYCNRLGQQMPAIKVMSAYNDQYNAAANRTEPEIVSVEFLNSTDPNEFLGKNMISTITIMRLASEHWWFLACQLCHKKAFQAGNAFVCSNKKCTNKTATPRYKVRVIGADASGETEFVFFATVAEQVIGKRLEVLMRTASPFHAPAEISALISQKLTLDFSVNEKGLQYGQLSFQVNSVTKVHMKTNVFEFHKLSVGSSSTSSHASPEVSKDATESDANRTSNEPEEHGTHDSPPIAEEAVHSTEKTPLSTTGQLKDNVNAAAADVSNSTNNKAKKRATKDDNKTSSAKKKLQLG